ncbi:DUF1501 domain-containing protein [Pelagibius marinus]|uniref:DUF1501 domain-containing protein n=1 Tax=Pelagibius marinus TaxID=2762760 RepID=UPI001D048423|nr:DUF1501 domain-containing protein [Pelagibius marinus]
MSFEITRRRLLTAAGAVPLAAGLPAGLARAGEAPRVLVLVELNGGNDGLNSVVPYADPAYAAARPTLAVARDRVLQLDARLGLHPALAPLMPLWQAREMTLALGVGYERPNRSHFRSIEIWNSASSAGETLREGWLHRVVTETGGGTDFLPRGIVLGGPEGPLSGPAMTTVVLRDPRQLSRAAALLKGRDAPLANPALAHILAERARMQGAARDIARRLKDAPPLTTEFPRTALGRQLQQAASLIAAGAPASVIKVQHSGYDTHARQAEAHAALLGELAAGLAAFRAAMIEAGAWRRTLVMTYAEFGRRVAENASGGSDHGTAAPHFLLGGRLQGGFLGEQPPLGNLEGGDLKPSLDFRRLYAAVAGDWLGLPPAPASLGRHAPLPLIA